MCTYSSTWPLAFSSKGEKESFKVISQISGVSKLSDFRAIFLCVIQYTRLSPGFCHLDLNLLLKMRFKEIRLVLSKEGYCVRTLFLHQNLYCLQIDITKAYDNVDWEFLLKHSWSIPITGEVHHLDSFVYFLSALLHFLQWWVGGLFRRKNGLRQGDPISSSLFVFTMDILSKKTWFGSKQECVFSSSLM